MLKSETVLEVKKGDRIYKLHCDGTSPLGELFDSLCDMQQFVIAKMNDSQPKREESAVVEPAEILPSEA